MGCQSSCWWWRASILGAGHTQITIISNYCKQPYNFCIAIHHLKEKKLRSGSPPLPSEASVPLSILLPAAHSGPSLQQYAALRIGNLPPDKKVAGWWWQGDVIPYPLYHFCTTWKMDGNRWMFMTFFGKLYISLGWLWNQFLVHWKLPKLFLSLWISSSKVNLLGSITACRCWPSRAIADANETAAGVAGGVTRTWLHKPPTWHEPWNPKSWLVYDGILILAYSNPHIIGK